MKIRVMEIGTPTLSRFMHLLKALILPAEMFIMMSSCILYQTPEVMCLDTLKWMLSP